VQPDVEPPLGLQLIPGGLLVTEPIPCPTSKTLNAGRLFTPQPGVPTLQDVKVAVAVTAAPVAAVPRAVIVA
jgi:hypothetical protein